MAAVDWLRAAGGVGGRVGEFRRGSMGGQDQNQNQVQNQVHVQKKV